MKLIAMLHPSLNCSVAVSLMSTKPFRTKSNMFMNETCMPLQYIALFSSSSPTKVFHHPLYLCSHSPRPFNVQLSVCPFPYPLSQHFFFLSFCLHFASRTSLSFVSTYSSYQQNVLLPHIYPSLLPFSYLFPSITLSVARHRALPASLQR